MNAGRIVAIAIWGLALGGTLVSFFAPEPAPPPELRNLPQLPKLLIVFPAVFFTVAAFLGGYPFDHRGLRLWVDRRWGDGTYVRFMQDLKPMLLLGLIAVAGAATCAVKEPTTEGPIVGYWACGFALSTGTGLLLARVMLARRGLLMESRSSSAWVERSASPSTPAAGDLRKFVPARMRRIRATNTTAALAGGALVAGPFMVAQSASLIWNLAPATYQSIGHWAQMLIFFVLVPFLVLGIQQGDHHSLKGMGRILVRGLCWMLGGAATAFALSLAQEYMPRLG
jgi:hypothetical protein